MGCVIVRENKIVGRGFNLRETGKNALNHAELIAIRDACKTLGGWRLCGCDLYVTLEPCPMCAGAMINARIENVYFGAFDPKAGACGIVNLFDLPFNHKPRVTGGVSGRNARAIGDFSQIFGREKSMSICRKRLRKTAGRSARPV